MCGVTKVKCTCHWPEEGHDFILKVKKGEKEKAAEASLGGVCAPQIVQERWSWARARGVFLASLPPYPTLTHIYCASCHSPVITTQDLPATQGSTNLLY